MFSSNIRILSGSDTMIKYRTIFIFYFLWLIMAWLIVSNKIAFIIKLYPLMTLLSILLLTFRYDRDVKKYLIYNYNSLYKELFKLSPMIDGFASLNFVFSKSDNQELQKVKNTGKIIYLANLILFISMALVAFLG